MALSSKEIRGTPIYIYLFYTLGSWLNTHLVYLNIFRTRITMQVHLVLSVPKISPGFGYLRLSWAEQNGKCFMFEKLTLLNEIFAREKYDVF